MYNPKKKNTGMLVLLGILAAVLLILVVMTFRLSRKSQIQESRRKRQRVPRGKAHRLLSKPQRLRDNPRGKRSQRQEKKQSRTDILS